MFSQIFQRYIFQCNFSLVQVIPWWVQSFSRHVGTMPENSSCVNMLRLLDAMVLCKTMPWHVSTGLPLRSEWEWEAGLVKAGDGIV